MINIKPEDIEKRSFEIISEELKDKGIILDPINELVIKRVIHTIPIGMILFLLSNG